MSKEIKNKIAPKLRFPEFRNGEEWKEETLECISPAIFDGTHQTPKYAAEGIPFFSVENIISGNKNKFISREDYLVATSKNKPEKGDILITRIGNIGFSKIVDWDYEFSIYVTLAVIKKSDKFYSYYLHSFFQSDYYQNELRSKSLLNAVPCKINMDELRKSKVLLPETKGEQQKIASCLSSLDDFITAQSQKLEALKEHKKGLMQQLFPAEGETVPKLRFSEFMDSGEWEERQLGGIGEFIGGGTPDTTKSEYWEGEIQWYTPTEIKEGNLKRSIRTITEEGLKNSSAKLLPKGALLITTRATIGDIGIANNECATNQGFQSLVVKDSEINYFWYYWIIQHKKELIRKASGSTFPEIGKNEIIKIKAFRPSKKEQQKIASCLSSLDELITAQTEKIEALKEHKKGLMQGLFPSTV